MPETNLMQEVVKRSAPSPLIAKLQKRVKTTDQITSPWFRCLLHGEIDSRKTSTAAAFGGVERTRIILTRGEDQMIPLRKNKYTFLEVDNSNEFMSAAMHCDQIWPDWYAGPEPVLVLDDLARAKDYVVKDNETFVDGQGNVKEHKDPRKVYGAAAQDMDTVFTVINDKPMHIVLVCTSRIRENELTQDETIFPDLTPSMANRIMSDYSYIFYINKKKPWDRCLLTSRDSESVTYYDEKKKSEITYQRVFFARNKVAVEDAITNPILKLYEPLDLRSIWDRVKGK